MPDKTRIGRGLVYFFIGLAIGSVFYQIITSGWRDSVRESQLLVQSQWALNERDWLALEYTSSKLISTSPRNPMAWRFSVFSALGLSDWDVAKLRLDIFKELVKDGFLEEIRNFTEHLENRTFSPPPAVLPVELPILGEPMVRAKLESLDMSDPELPVISLKFDKPVAVQPVVRAATFYEYPKGSTILAKTPTQLKNPDLAEKIIRFIPSRNLELHKQYIFVVDLPQQRMGGAWMPYAFVMKLEM